MKIVFATHNAHKVSEVQAVLGSEYQLVTATEAGITEEIPETQPLKVTLCRRPVMFMNIPD